MRIFLRIEIPSLKEKGPSGTSRMEDCHDDNTCLTLAGGGAVSLNSSLTVSTGLMISSLGHN